MQEDQRRRSAYRQTRRTLVHWCSNTPETGSVSQLRWSWMRSSTTCCSTSSHRAPGSPMTRWMMTSSWACGRLSIDECTEVGSMMPDVSVLCKHCGRACPEVASRCFSAVSSRLIEAPTHGLLAIGRSSCACFSISVFILALWSFLGSDHFQ